MDRQEPSSLDSASQPTPPPNYPKGKLCPGDEGELIIRFWYHGDELIAHFSKPITWLGFDKDSALELADRLLIYVKGLQQKAGLKMDPDDIPIPNPDDPYDPQGPWV
jgi:hypothetical protein